MIRNLSARGSTLLPLIVAGFVFVMVVSVGYFIYHQAMTHKNPNSSHLALPVKKPTTNSAYAILKPATVPSKITECSQALTYASDGNPAPVQCANGALNVLDWQALAALEPTVMKLGYAASQAQVQSAICTDGSVAAHDYNPGIGVPLETNAYQLASLYYGWNYSLNPRTILSAAC